MDRTLGSFPLSIATSLAIESACNIHPELKHRSVPLLEFDQLWVNVKTLFRNYEGSLDKYDASRVMPVQAAQDIYSEMGSIVQAVTQFSNRTKVVFYVSDYKGLEHYKMGVVRMDNTPNQKAFTTLMIATISILMKEQKDFEIKTFDLKLKGSQPFPKSLILTHIPFDLFSRRNFADLVLLESHTGAIKTNALWYTKYLNGKELNFIPFREDLVQIFGDNETFRPGDPKLRKEIIEIAKKDRWTAVTTTDRIRYSIGNMKNHYARDLIKGIIVN